MTDPARDPERIFHDARQIRDRAERDGFLAHECEGDEALRERLERLLAAEVELGSFLNGGEPREAPGDGRGDSAPTAASPPLSERPGSVIGRYKLLQQIGEGGFGVVYMAEQEEPVRRKVALKIIKLGMDTRQVIARFEGERQALALMDHPHIAKVLDAGATETGRPYFVMELVRGLPITDYCDKESTSLRERLSLFIAVCSAVQHAHQKGIIHRDLKPSNILVTLHDGKPVPRVIDFGIAKATEQRLTERTMFTEYGQFMGTPAYMSPEQAEMSGLDIDSRSDIYSLGVLLYELLTGATPFDMRTLRGAALDEIRRIIREDEPSKPSTRISTVRENLDTVAKCRGVEPRKLGTILRGDLDWIVMKALEKDRQRRYETASGLGMDIQRYLTGEAVEAAPPSAPYRLKKLVRRNKGVVTAGALLAAALVVGVIGTTWGMVWALNEKERADTAAAAERTAQAQAQERADALEKVAKFQAEQLSGIDVPLMGLRLRESLLQKVRVTSERSVPDPDEAAARLKEVEKLIGGVDFTGMATEALDANIFQRALTAINTQFADQPLVKARLLQTVADSLVGVGLLEPAKAPQDEALRIRRSALGDDHADTLASISASAILLGKQGRFDQAKPFFEEAIERRRRTLGNDHPDTLTAIFAMATLLYFQGQYSQAEPYFRESLEGRRRVLGGDHPETLQSIRNEGSLRVAQGRLREAEALHREALETCRATLGADHPDTLMSMTALCGTFKWQGKYAEAEELDRAIVDGRRRQLGDDHPDTLNAASSLGEALRNLKKLSEAEVLLRDVTDRQRRLLGSDHPDTLVSISRLGLLLSDLARYEEAEPYYREALDGRRRRLGSDHTNTLASLNNMGFLLQRMGRFAEADVHFHEALEARRRTNGPDHPATLTVLFNIGRLQYAQVRFVEAEAIFRDVLERRRRAVGDDHPDTQNTLQALGVLLKKTGGYPEAEQVLRECHQLRRKALPAGDPRIDEALSLLGDAIAKQGRFGEAEPMLLDAHERLVQPASADLRRDAAQRIVDLYDAWHEAEPKGGHDAQAADWKVKLEEMKAPAQDVRPDEKK